MDKANLLKKIVGAISSVLSSMLGILYIPVSAPCNLQRGRLHNRFNRS